MAITLTNDQLKFRESIADPWQNLLVQANMNFNLIYPVGSIYMSTVNVDPGTIFGGTWERLKDKFLLGAGDTYTAGDTGGEATHTLTVDEMPSHNHTVARGSNIGTTNWGIVRFDTLNSSADETRISQTGGDQPHNNMPPYLVVYMWRRLTLSPTIYTPPANVLIGEVASEDIVPVTKGGTGANNAADALANLGIGMDLLWTNSNPSESFAAQTIATGDYSGYTMFLVRFKFAKTSTAERKPFICFPNQTTSAQEPNVASSLGGISRDFTFSSSEITCTIASVNTTSSTSSDHFIPLYIYGIKL